MAEYGSFAEEVLGEAAKRSTITNVERQYRNGPPGYDTFAEWDGSRGVIQLPPTSFEPTESERLLKEEFCRRIGVNADDIEIDGRIRVSSWDAQAAGGQKRDMYAYRANVILKGKAPEEDAWIQRLLEEAKSFVPAVNKPVELMFADWTFVFNVSDLQMGKGDGEGYTHTMRRFYEAVTFAKAQIKLLQGQGYPLGSVLLTGLGDLIENCDGHYAQQLFTTELTERAQRQIATDLVWHAVKELAPLVPVFMVACVGGNHGENRKDGKSHTDFSDNSDVEIFDNVRRLAAVAPGLEHVKFSIPYDELHQAVTLPNGQIVGLAHGHQAAGSGPPAQKIVTWWKNMAFGSAGYGNVAEAKYLFTGHYHFFQMTNYDTRRIHFQCPALDGGSKWFADRYGYQADDGVLTLVITPDTWKYLQLL